MLAVLGWYWGALLALSFSLGHGMLRFPARLLLPKEPQGHKFCWHHMSTVFFVSGCVRVFSNFRRHPTQESLQTACCLILVKKAWRVCGDSGNRVLPFEWVCW